MQQTPSETASDDMAGKSAGDIVVEALRAESVAAVFGIVGSHVVGIYDALRRAPDIRAVSARHEGSASFMAAGFARLTGRAGVAIVTAGPGVLNALNGVAQAQFSAQPLIVIAGGPPLGARPYELHGLAREDYCIESVRPLVMFAARARSVEDVAESLSRAFATARSGRPGPAYVEIPWNLFARSATTRARYLPAQIIRSGIAPLALENVRTALAAARRPLFILDKGVLHGQARAEIVRLAERAGAELAVTRDAIGAVNETHPLYRGVAHDHNFGAFGFEAVARADLCLLFGFDEGADNTRMVEARAGGTIFHLAEMHEGSDAVSVGDACRALSAAVGIRASRDVIANDYLADKQARIAAINVDSGTNLFVKTLARLQERMSENDISVIDAGNHEVWARTILPVSGPRSCVGGANWASMGYAAPTAIAARAAHPDARVFCVTGDGCLLMSLSDLATFFEAGGPSVLLLLNDSEYGMMTDVQEARFGAPYQSILPRINFAALAQAMGGRALRIVAPGDIEPALEEALSSSVPVLLDIACGRPPLPVFPPIKRRDALEAD